jgi:hypothetical protein
MTQLLLCSCSLPTHTNTPSTLFAHHFFTFTTLDILKGIPSHPLEATLFLVWFGSCWSVSCENVYLVSGPAKGNIDDTLMIV